MTPSPVVAEGAMHKHERRPYPQVSQLILTTGRTEEAGGVRLTRRALNGRGSGGTGRHGVRLRALLLARRVGLGPSAIAGDATRRRAGRE
jgi:hypothetical protein